MIVIDCVVENEEKKAIEYESEEWNEEDKREGERLEEIRRIGEVRMEERGGKRRRISG